MDFGVEMVIGFFIGVLISLIYLRFIMRSGGRNKEYDAYMQGYCDGIKRAEKDKEKEVA